MYFDYAATTPLDEAVKCHLFRAFEENWGNAGAVTHEMGFRAAFAVEQARQQVASLLCADPREIIFTSGATESNNLALQGAARAQRKRGQHFITVQTEHKAVLDPLKYLANQGYSLTLLPVDDAGRLSLPELQAALRPDTVLVSVMAVNNETGVMQNLVDIGKQVKANGSLFHIDAAQGAGKIALNVNELAVDLLSMSAHKIYGPPGVGALYVRRLPKARIEPLLFGGGQEFGLRPGTLPVPFISAFGLACELAQHRLVTDTAYLQSIHHHFLTRITNALPQIVVNGANAMRVPHIVNLRFTGIDAESLLGKIRPCALAMGSACTAAQLEPSHVLQAMGLTAEQARSSVRISLGHPTTMAEVDQLATQLITATQALRRVAGFTATNVSTL